VINFAFEKETETMFTISRRFAIAATLATALMSAPVLAQELTGTLKKIKETGSSRWAIANRRSRSRTTTTSSRWSATRRT
jgi:hypothetical protein